jgi:hypothetical protein
VDRDIFEGKEFYSGPPDHSLNSKGGLFKEAKFFRKKDRLRKEY